MDYWNRPIDYHIFVEQQILLNSVIPVLDVAMYVWVQYCWAIALLQKNTNEAFDGTIFTQMFLGAWMLFDEMSIGVANGWRDYLSCEEWLVHSNGTSCEAEWSIPHLIRLSIAWIFFKVAKVLGVWELISTTETQMFLIEGWLRSWRWSNDLSLFANKFKPLKW